MRERVSRAIRAVSLLARDEAILLAVAPILWLLYRAPLRDAWRNTAAHVSQENVDKVRRAFEATEREDWPAIVADYDAEVEIRDHDIPDAKVWTGPEGYFAWLEYWAESFESWKIEDIEYRDAGNGFVIAVFQLTATGKGSGAEVSRRDAMTFLFRDGKVIRQDYYNNEPEALAAIASASHE